MTQNKRFIRRVADHRAAILLHHIKKHHHREIQMQNVHLMMEQLKQKILYIKIKKKEKIKFQILKSTLKGISRGKSLIIHHHLMQLLQLINLSLAAKNNRLKMFRDQHPQSQLQYKILSKIRK